VTGDYDRAVSFYSDLFGLEASMVSDPETLRYSTLGRDGQPLAGVMSGSGILPEGAAAQWVVYLGVADTDAAVAKVSDLGGTLVDEALDTPFGRMATVADTFGVSFRLITTGGPAGRPGNGPGDRTDVEPGGDGTPDAGDRDDDGRQADKVDQVDQVDQVDKVDKVDMDR